MIDLRKEICKIVSEMLDNPDKYGIYPTTNCYDDLISLFQEAIRETIEEIDIGIRKKSGQWEGQTIEWINGNKYAFRDMLNVLDALKKKGNK